MKNFLALLSISAFLLPVFSVPVVSAQPKVKSFAEWCQQKNAVSAATKDTIDVLLTKAGTKNCQLADRQLRRLTKLSLSNNKITDLKPLAGLNNLTELALDHNQIGNIDLLASLTKLTYFSLESNQISNVKPLARLTKLKTLTLDKNLVNPITSVTTQPPNNNELSDEGLTTKSVGDEQNFTSISQLKDMKPSDSYYQAVQSLTKRYGVMYVYNDRKFHAERRLTRGQLISFLNSSLDRVNEIMAAASADSRVPVKFGYCSDKSLAINEIFRVECSLYKNNVTSVSQIKDVKSTDTYFVNLQSLTERYNIKLIDPDNYFRSSKPVTKKEFYDLMNLIFNYRPVGSPLVTKKPLTRGEFITFFNKMLDRAVERIGVATSRPLK